MSHSAGRGVQATRSRGHGLGRIPLGRIPLGLLTLVLVVVTMTPMLGAGAAAPAGAASTGSSGSGGSPSSLVNVFAGTGTGSVSPGAVGEFPAADLPFGMIQWGPDTSPDRVDGSGYSYDDHLISGFSLTHMSGTGCASYGDVPILPVTGSIGTDPEATTQRFSHRQESASPGRYRVKLGSPSIDTQLAVTTRTGISSFTYPKTRQASLLFKVSDSAAGAKASAVHISGDDTVTGQVTSGGFCGTGTPYTLYFAAQFNRPFSSSGVWSDSTVTAGGASCDDPSCGAYVTFDTMSHQQVMMKVGISFVSVAGAQANLQAENPGWSLTNVEAAGTKRWDQLLDRIQVGGGTQTERRTFETALYHSLLHPNIVSDANGEYTGEDGDTHYSSAGQYANFSEWDIYRSEIELISLLAPHQAGAMIQSLVEDADQEGWLPKWAIVDGDAAQMNGDSADPIIASAYAFGVRGFDASAALNAMVKGATEQESPHGLEIERQDLDQYLSQHYVDASTPDLGSITYTAGASMTLEYAIDDFSIAQLASALGHHTLASQMMERAHNWEYLFNPANGHIQGRNDDGSFPPGPAFNTRLLEPGGENGFEEGNAIQYTWSVPQDLAGLAALMGGNKAAVLKLNGFFTELNAGRDEPHDWAGNEPNLWTPWEYDYFGAPYRTQSVVRQIMTKLYGDGPVDEPGNDDLGALSSWYVWAALGLYPVTPGTANLALAAPLFPSTKITLPDGKRVVLRASGAGADDPYIQQLQVTSGKIRHQVTSCPPTSRTVSSKTAENWDSPWLPASVLTTGGTFTYTLSSTPSTSWGSSTSSAPPSYASGRIESVGYSLPSGGVNARAGVPTRVTLGVQSMSAGTSPVTWRASATGGVTVSPSSGSFAAPQTAARKSPTSCPVPSPVSTPLTVTAPGAGKSTVTVALTSGGVTLPPVVIDVAVSGAGKHLRSKV